jgi:tetratricopeptide (TPR) repeat protein
MAWLMTNTLIKLLTVTLILILASGLPAQELRDPQFVEGAKSGFSDIFNMDYDEAKEVFISLEKQYPLHPAPPLYLASILWLEEMLRRQDLDLNRFMAPSYFSRETNESMPSRERAAFFEDLQRSEALSNAILKNNPQDKDARYFLGTSYGLRSTFAITIDHSLREAFGNGNKAYSYSRQLVKEDPDYYDAYLISGAYEYIVGSIPWYLKWMAFVIGIHGSKEEGLRQLRLASEKGQYVRDQAQLVLLVLDVREHDYAEALAIARELNNRYPRNFLFPLNIAQILKMAGHKDQAIAVLLQVEKRAENKEPNFDRLPIQTFRFNLATELLYMGKLDPAEERFRECIHDPQSTSREIALSHLRLGKILNWKGQRNQAIRESQIVLSLEDIENSHREARQLLKKSYRR